MMRLIKSNCLVTGLLLLTLGAGEQAMGEDAMITLPLPSKETFTRLESVLSERHSVREFGPGGLSLTQISRLLWAAQGIRPGTDRRTAPSAGALYPLELSLLAGRVEGLSSGLYRYHPHEHGLNPLLAGDLRIALAEAALGQDWISDAPAALVVSGVYRRTRSKYGERAERYVHIEAGHAAQNVLLQAVDLGLGATVVGAFDDRVLQRLLRLSEREQPLLIIPVGQLRE